MSATAPQGSPAHPHPRAALDADSVRDAYRRWANVYDTVFGGISAFGRKRAVAAVNRLPGLAVLEVGVGTGLALPRYDRVKRVTGIDLSREMLDKARERVAAEGLTHVDALLEMDAEAMAFPDASFDIAVAMFTASVVPDARRLFAEMQRVVRPGGRLLFVNHFAAEAGPRWWVERAMAPLSRTLGWHPDFNLRDLLDPTEARIESLESAPPAGLFTLVQIRNGSEPARVQAAAA
ncbi:phosphatidylethanolamine/phosphatidyl-N-methylethanolamine N-methyltransferase [Humitalea rosea]|uniref:Phosphatidylethanolamine/phosphatidyl-N-methylethanolamine N-methyltransferase n=1 Tax=Humitalea rosea TaxID=990373 RepID=A0A2W7IWV2_9PROT|nr:class I SAM-dependent methyltransferase [Humitalea rosea]PZW43173.1 phosphatidylethanolamine/phosphatidyl-N-methylethanolamine N-methyltransferase [Humitalea rosea]